MLQRFIMNNSKFVHHITLKLLSYNICSVNTKTHFTELNVSRRAIGVPQYPVFGILLLNIQPFL